MMWALFLIIAALCGAWAATFIWWGNRTGTVIAFLAAFMLAVVLQHFSGMAALPDARLAGSEWRVLAVSPIDGDLFLLSVRYPSGDIRTYRLTLSDPKSRDAFLQAAQAMKKGRALQGIARHSRAGLPRDSDMDFAFRDIPESEPK